jgi:dTDP-4-dehydrorhamnose 3,5-epimerase
MELRQRRLDGLYDLVAPRLTDSRGYLHKPYDARGFAAAAGAERVWRQIIVSHTAKAGTLRGLYVQRAPFTEGKAVVCLRGRMWWVVVDLRCGSPSFGAWEGTDLMPGSAIYIEPGYAHGCLALADDTDLLLMADSDHSDAAGIGLLWNDPDLAIGWPLDGAAPALSAAHAAGLSLAEFKARHGAI